MLSCFCSQDATGQTDSSLSPSAVTSTAPPGLCSDWLIPLVLVQTCSGSGSGFDSGPGPGSFPDPVLVLVEPERLKVILINLLHFFFSLHYYVIYYVMVLMYFLNNIHKVQKINILKEKSSIKFCFKKTGFLAQLVCAASGFSENSPADRTRSSVTGSEPGRSRTGSQQVSPPVVSMVTADPYPSRTGTWSCRSSTEPGVQQDPGPGQTDIGLVLFTGTRNQNRDRKKETTRPGGLLSNA